MPSLLPHPHPGQKIIIKETHKYTTVSAGRRFGKTLAGLFWVCKVVIDFPDWMAWRGYPDQTIYSLRRPVVVVAMPTMTMAKQIWWGELTRIFEALPEVTEKINRTTLTIFTKGNRPDIIVRGVNDQDGDRLRGLKIVAAMLDEAQDMNLKIIDGVLFPAMVDTPGSQAKIIGTPKGKLNVLYRLFQRQQLDPDNYISYHFKTADNPTIPREEIEKARMTMTPRLYRQEYEADFLDFQGAVYSELSTDNFVEYYPNKFDLVVAGYDFGDRNPAIVIFGRNGENWFLLDYWQPPGTEPVSDPQQWNELYRLCQFHQVHYTYCDPSRPNSILSLREQGKKRKCTGMINAMAANNRIEDGIQYVHSLMFHQKFFIPSKFEEYYDLMKSYHRKTDKNGVVLEKIEDGQNDHLVDATRYALAVLKK